jgi:hypothetical protein
MTLYLELPGSGGKLDRLLGEFAAVALPGPPGGLDEVSPDKALICVVAMGDYEAPGYIITEIELATWTDPADTRPRTWLLMDRWMADRLCCCRSFRVSVAASSLVSAGDGRRPRAA